MLGSGSGLGHYTPLHVARCSHLRCTCTHMPHSLGSLDFSDNPASQVTGESCCISNLQRPVFCERDMLVNYDPLNISCFHIAEAVVGVGLAYPAHGQAVENHH